MPTISLTRLAIIAAKVALMALIFTFFVSYIDVFSATLTGLFSSMTGVLTTANGLDLGYVSYAIGFTSFLNLLIGVIYLAISLYLTGMFSVIVFKLTLRLYTYVMSI